MVEYRDNVIKMLGSKRAEEIYAAVKDLPIIDYHCHLSPREIYEDKPFGDIGEIWLAVDHYKWRLMRGYGVDEKYITGNASWAEKFDKFAEAVGYALGNPVKDWVAAELMFFFGITTPLNKDTAEEVREKANAVIKEKGISPRKLIESANVEYIATTDDPCDSLEWHDKIAKEGALKGYLYVFLAAQYKKRGITMQMHLAVTRNSNSAMFAECGADSGFDCVGDAIDTVTLTRVIDTMSKNGGLPETIIYTLNPSMYYTLITMIGAFRGVHLGVSWWFCDHKRGMRETFDRLSELGHICSLVGMLTDSRSFLSYTRHDYYRQCLCDFLADNSSERDGDAPVEVAKKLCYYNAKKLLED